MNKIAKLSTIYILLLLVPSSCSSVRYCKKSKDYVKEVDMTKPFRLKGEYCVSSISKKKEEGTEVILNIYDRISGKPLDGMVFLTDSIVIKSEFTSGKLKKVIPHGDYQIEIASTGPNSLYSLPFSTKKIKFPDFSTIEVNCYVGGILQH